MRPSRASPSVPSVCPPRSQVEDDIELVRAIDKFKPGDRVTLTVSRFDEDDNEQELRIPITLQAMDTA